MPFYSVIWTIGIDAPNPELAAVNALDAQRDHNSIATVFHVRQDVDSRSLADSELQDRGYKSIDLETATVDWHQVDDIEPAQ